MITYLNNIIDIEMRSSDLQNYLKQNICTINEYEGTQILNYKEQEMSNNTYAPPPGPSVERGF